MDELQHRGRLVDDHIPVAMALKNVEILTAQQCIAQFQSASTCNAMDMEDKAHVYHSWHPADRTSSMDRKLPQHSADEGGDRAAQQCIVMVAFRAPAQAQRTRSNRSYVKQIDHAPDIGIF